MEKRGVNLKMPLKIEGVSHVDTKELKQMLEEKGEDILFIDVRGPEEYVNGHIPGVPLVPMGHIPHACESMDKKAEYVFICQGGIRSFHVAKYMQQCGFENVHNFAGGMQVWDGEIAYGLENVPASYDPASLKRKADRTK